MIHTRPRTYRDDHRHPIRWLAVVIAAGAVARLVALLLHPPLNTDEARYLVTAHHLRSGVGYEDWHGPEIDILPLHPVLTAVLGAGPGTLEWRGRLVAFAASILVLPMLAALAWEEAGPAAALLAVAITAFHPWLLDGAARPQPESLYVLLVLSALLTVARIRTGAMTFIGWALAGALLGLAYLARPEGILVALALGALIVSRATGRRAGLTRGALYLGALLLTVLPYMLWLHQATGHWMLTGKSNEVFFIGQAMYGAGDRPPGAEECHALERRYGTWFTFVREDPGAFLGRLSALGLLIFGWMLPRALGPLGILGWCGLLLRRTGHDDDRPAPLWTTLPALVLPLMMMTFPNQRIAATAISFLAIPAAVGLARASGHLRRFMPAGALAGAAVMLLLVPWYPAAKRVARGDDTRPVPIERRFATEALAVTGDIRSIATNSPVVSYYLRDPDMFGTPGTYRPLEAGLACPALVDELRRRAATVAVIDRWTGAGPPLERGQECPLEVVDRFLDTATERRMEIVRLGP
jgi:4-amino-4-deoxy-L-arabinose transferase-like glycosyltransferase